MNINNVEMRLVKACKKGRVKKVSRLLEAVKASPHITNGELIDLLMMLSDIILCRKYAVGIHEVSWLSKFVRLRQY